MQFLDSTHSSSGLLPEEIEKKKKKEIECFICLSEVVFLKCLLDISLLYKM